jgi:hypothetical protein
MDPGVLTLGAFNADEGAGVPHRGNPVGVFDLHAAAVNPRGKLAIRHRISPNVVSSML